MSTCGKCGKKVFFMEQAAYKGGFWHKACFKCETCKKSLEPGGFLDHDNLPYCNSCFKKQFQPKGYGFGSNNLHSFEHKGGSSAAASSSPGAASPGKAAAAPAAAAAAKPASAASSPTSKAAATPAPAASKAPAAAAPKAAEKKDAAPAAAEVNKLDRDRWYIENFDGKKSKRTDPIVVNVTEVKQSVYIGKCTGVVVQIHGKCKQVTINGCTETGVVTETVVSTVEVINSKKCQVQLTEKVGLVQLDGCERTSVYLSQAAVDEETKMFTAKSAATLIYVPQADGDLKELALPEQFVSCMEEGTFKNEIVVPEAILS